MEGPVLMMAKGINGTLELLPDRIRIRRQGWIAPFYDRHTRTELLMRQITEIEFKETIGGIAGYLAFHDDSGRETFEDFCVSFLRHQQPAFSAFKKAMEPLWHAVQDSLADTKLQITHVEHPSDGLPVSQGWRSQS